MVAFMLEEHGMGGHVDMGCVHGNIEHIIAERDSEHGTDGQLDLEQFKTSVHEAEDPVGPCFHE